MTAQPQFPTVKVVLVGESTHVRDIIARVSMALAAAGERDAAISFEETATMLADANELQAVLDLVVATVDATGDGAESICYYCEEPAMDSDIDLCEHHYNLDQEFRRQLGGRDEN